MNAIVGLTHLLEKDVPGVQGVQGKQRLAKIVTAVNHLLSVINDILDLSKIEARRLNLQESEFSPRDMAAQIIALIEALRLGQALLDFLGNVPCPAWAICPFWR